MTPLRELSKIFFDAFKAWLDDHSPRQAAALAYFTIFTIAPLLVVIIAFVGLFLGEQQIRNEIRASITTSIGPEAAELVQGLIDSTFHPSGGLISTIISLVLLMLGALAVFNHLQAVLNIIWKVPQPTNRSEGILRFLRGRLVAFAMILVAGALIVLSLIVNTLVAVYGRQVLDPLPGTEAILQVTNFLLSYGATTALFMMIFKFLPNARTYWLDSFIGAAITTFLFSLGRMALVWYFANAAPSSAYGAAGSLIAMLVWVNYSAQIILYGAEFTHTFSRARSKQIAERSLPKNPFMP